MTEIGAEMPEVVSTMPTTTVPETTTNNSNDSLPALNASLKGGEPENKTILEAAAAKEDKKLAANEGGDSPAVVDSTDSAVVNTKDSTNSVEDGGKTTAAAEAISAVTEATAAVSSSEDKKPEEATAGTAAAAATEPKTTANVEQNNVKENGADTGRRGSADSDESEQKQTAALASTPASPSPPPSNTAAESKTTANASSLDDVDKKQAVDDDDTAEVVMNSDEKQPEAKKADKADKLQPPAAAAAEASPTEALEKPSQKENGIVEKRKPSNDGGIVDLGDDTDDDMMQVDTDKAVTRKQSIDQNLSSAGKNGHDTSTTTNTKTTTSIATTPLNLNASSNTTITSSPRSSNEHNASTVLSDSDGAVVINSDSESEEILSSRKPNEFKRLSLPPPTATTTTLTAAQQQQQQTAAVAVAMAAAAAAASASSSQQIVDDDDDDDDDCVVIEDNTPAPAANSDLNKRKSLASSAEDNTGEDLQQPPSKRMRSSMLNVSGGGGDPLNIHMDTRISVPDTLNIKKVVSGENNIYPVTITPSSAMNTNQGPPKLVPMSSTTVTAMNLNTSTSMTAAGVGGAALGSNAALLPGLTDDMFVLEAPSFIVPYIYEKPPAVGLSEVVKEIEAKHNLTKEDLAMADKTDDFDMMTEQNKTEKLDADTKKKKKRKAGDDGDESWSEQSEEEEDDDDDDDSDQGVKTKVLIKEASDDLTALQGAIKPAAAVAQSAGVGVAQNNAAAKPGQENYFESPLGKFFMDIGVGLVQEFVQSDLIRLQKRKMRKSLGKNTMEFERAISALSGNLEASKRRNSPFKFTMKRCEFCNFKSESALAMANHYETPHMNGPLYKCNFCTFEIRNATEIVYHMEAVHNIKARLIKPLPYHQCPNCGFEDNGKAKMARHQPVCAKKFRPELNLAPTNDWEAPAKIPRIKPRHGLVGTATAYQAMAAQAAAQKAALATIQQQQQVQQQQRTLQAAAMAAQTAANKMRGRAPIVPKAGPTPGGMIRQPHPPIRTPMASNVVLQNNYQLPGNQLLQNAANAMAKKANAGGQPSISITPLPRQAAAPASAAAASTSKVPAAGVKPGQSPGSNKAQFVICEICDGYIKDLEQLRNHMQWMHKVKIHPKMIYNRPPLNCQKCQFRFFTDQGLERHLLGSHGLVTSSMQEAANKGKDSGRCPVCGRMYQWKLLNHVSRDHHMTLKPAHLSYKCTVCTATFGMYKQFETHVYTAHSTVAKRAMDGKKTNAPGGGGPSGSAGPSGGSSSQRLPTTNDSILKPLKINDEITIIPQPATKPRITNVESHVID